MATNDERKEIIIDPSMFKINNNKTKKQRGERAPPKIKIKGQKPEKKQNKASTLKRNLLRMIRGHQEKRMKDSIKPKNTIPSSDTPPKSDFEQSIQFMSQINKSQQPVDSLLLKRNQTLKHYPNPISQSAAYHPQHASPPPYASPQYASPPPYASPPQYASPQYASPQQPIHALNLKKPNYGCLKNGNLPTYRVWKNQTLRQKAPPQIPKSIMRTSPVQVNYESQLRDKIKEMSEREQHNKLKQPILNKIWKKPKKQRRILRKTFRIGKSKSYPVISVLVSNKTLRNETNLKHTELKEKPISEVKQYLKKQGFIKVGTNTPNDVLREMYESASMICGEVKNYSPENLLYNYFNADIGNERE
jgi:hypothetical protein